MLHQKFSAIANTCPDTCAVVQGDTGISYQDLDRITHTLAKVIQDKGIGFSSRILIYLPPGIEFIQAMLGILKAGSTYVPMDISDPFFRTQNMINQLNPDLIITQNALKIRFNKIGPIPVMAMESLLATTTNDVQETLDEEQQKTPDAYIIHTSGSTGIPKGIGISHGAVFNLISALDDIQEIGKYDQCSLWASLGFDVSIFEIWSALISGASLHIPTDLIRFDSQAFMNWLADKKITNAYIPPFMLGQMAKSNHQFSLKRILTGTEPIAESLLCQVQQKTPGLRLINGYGPSEATVCATLYPIPELAKDPLHGQYNMAPIGKPIKNLRIILVDHDDNQVKQGEKGEICISGIQVTKGYINAPDQSAKAFARINGFDMYKTGDMGYLLEDGNLMFSRRKDFQIKYRGVRIEPGDIETHLRTFGGISQAAVVLKPQKGGEKKLTAYINAKVDTNILFEFLRSRLSRTMLPSTVIFLDELPQTAQGKIDRDALLKRDDTIALMNESGQQGSSRPYKLSAIEQVVADIWKEVLGCSITCGYDNFFLLGGNSISGVRIIARINDRFGTSLSIHLLFDSPELKSFSRQVKAVAQPLPPKKETKKRKLSPTGLSYPLEDHFPLLPDQELIWQFETVNPGTSVYHIPLVYKVSGPLDLKIFEKTMKTMVQHHPALANTFSLKQGELRQQQGETRPEFLISTEDDLDQKLLKHPSPNSDLSPDDPAVIKWVKHQTSIPFDLARGPLFRTAVLKFSPQLYLVCFIAHHLVFDGWSAALFIDTLNQVYESLIKNDDLNIPDQGHAFHDHVFRENKLAKGRWEAAQPFFSIYFKDLPKQKESNRAAPDAHIQFTASTCPVNLDKDLYQRVRETARENGTTPFVVLLSIFQLLLSAKSGQDNQATGIAYAGRNQVETESVVGFFMNTLVVKNLIPFHTSFTSFLSQMKKNLDTLFQYKEIPFHTLQEFCREQGLDDQIINALFLMQTMDSPILSLGGMETQYIYSSSHETNIDLTLELYETPMGANGWFKYKAKLFRKEEAEQISAQFQKIACLVLGQPEDELETLLGKFSVHPRETEDLKSRAGEILAMTHFPVSPMQHGMLMETLRAPQGAGCYVEQVVFTMNREIDPTQFAAAWDTIISHHQTLRLGFRWKGQDYPEQYIVPPTPLRIEYNDWSNFTKPEQQEYIGMFLKADRRLGFSLDNPPAYRVALIKTSPRQFTCIWSFHHCIEDGRSMGFILRDLFQVYESPGAPLKSAGSFQYFIAWLYSQKRRAAEQFWRRNLAGFDEPMVFPFRMEEVGEIRSQRQAHAMSLTTGHHHVDLSPITARQIKKLCQDNQLTMNSFLMGAWAILLSHYTGKTDILFGTTVSVRQFKSNQEDNTGLYINTLPVRINIQPDHILVNYIQDIRDRWRRIRAHDHFSLTDIHALSPIQGSQPLSEIYFSYDYQTLDTALAPYKSTLSCSEICLLERTPAAIFLTAQGVENLTISIEYDQRKFNARTTRQILDHFTCFLKSASENPQACLKDLPVLTSTETALIEEKLNTRQGHLPPRTCFHHLFEIQASVNQSTPAVTDGKTNYTYGQLNLFANQIAHYLMAKDAGPEKKVLLFLDQDADLIAILLGVLKSGAGYIPIDISYPMDRIHYIMEDADPDFIITTLARKNKLPDTTIPTIFMDQDKSRIQAMPSANPITRVTPGNMAYIIYTSGSTGHPKGVVIEHGSLASFTKTASETYDLVPTDQVLQFASISFDASAEEIYPTLFSGATLVIKPRSLVHTPGQFFDYCREHQLTVVDLPTAYWHLIADQITTLNPPDLLRLMIIGGDAAHPDKVRKWQNAMGDRIRLLNTYGPTETTVAVTYADLSQMPVETAQVPIGSPFSTVNLCILNHFHQPAPPGVTGELFIGGPQVARGYLNRDKKTENTFVPIGFLGNQDRFFKTNDHAKMLPSGQIIFLGRIDRQIKIRGFRVEPEEIEKTALLHDQIKECALAVSPTADGNTRLTAFVVFEEGPGVKTKPFKEWMQSRLPEYMVPSTLIPMANLPYTASGKVDYKALDKAVQHPTTRKQKTDHQALTRIQDHYETGLTQIWEEILGSSGFESTDNFFDVGGSSLTAIRLVTAIENHFHVAIPVLAVFQFPRLQDLAHVLRQKDNSIQFSSVKAIKGQGSQTPIFFVAGTEENTQAYKDQDLRDHPLYTITVFAHKTRGPKIIPMDIWEIARRNVREILQAQPAGPYIIIGFCRYSLVAYEIASQLITMGKSVEQLIFLDEFWQKKGNEPDSGLGRRIKSLIPKTKQALRSYAHSLNKRQGKFYNAIGKPLPETLQAKLMESSFWKAYESYIPLPYPGDAVVLDSLNWTKKYTPGLRTYIQGKLKTVPVPALHSNWFDPSQIQTILSAIETAPPDKI